MAKASVKKKKQQKKKGLRGLEHGDIIDVVAPGFGCPPEDLDNARIWLEALGFQPRIPASIFGPDLLHAQKDSLRAEQLIKALKAKDSKAIWFLRGGYGSNRLLPFLKNIKPHPKLLIGISDITSIHSYALQKWRWPAYHGPLLDRVAKDLVPEPVLSEALQVLQGKIQEVIFSQLVPLNAKARVKKSLKGSVVGGNLKVIESHIGTPDELSFKKRLVVFEEIGERAYRVDRMLFHLEQAGCFKNCLGVLFGQFIQDQEPQGQPGKTQELLRQWAEKQSFPVLRGLAVGHDVEQRILPLGTQAQLILGAQAELRVSTGVQKCD